MVSTHRRGVRHPRTGTCLTPPSHAAPCTPARGPRSWPRGARAPTVWDWLRTWCRREGHGGEGTPCVAGGQQRARGKAHARAPRRHVRRRGAGYRRGRWRQSAYAASWTLAAHCSGTACKRRCVACVPPGEAACHWQLSRCCAGSAWSFSSTSICWTPRAPRSRSTLIQVCQWHCIVVDSLRPPSAAAARSFNV